jgi:protein SCO1/2
LSIREIAPKLAERVATFMTGSLGTAADDYTVDHTAHIYLMDRDGNYLGFVPPSTSADRMVEIIRPRLAEPAR